MLSLLGIAIYDNEPITFMNMITLKGYGRNVMIVMAIVFVEAVVCFLIVV